MKIIFSDGKAYLELTKNYLIFIGSEKFIRDLTARERTDLVQSIVLEIKFSERTIPCMPPISKMIH